MYTCLFKVRTDNRTNKKANNKSRKIRSAKLTLHHLTTELCSKANLQLNISILFDNK